MSVSISIIIPVYNVEKYLCECIDSVLNQTFKDFELILVDDGSTDKSGIICDEYKLKDNRIKVIHQKNSGVSVARNTGISNAKNEYITFIDSDDYIDQTMYEKMSLILEKYKCDVVLCDCNKEFGNHSELYTHNIRGGYYNYKQLLVEYYPQLLITKNIEYPATISNCVMLFKKSILNNEINYEAEIRYSEDWLFGCILMLKCKSFYYMKGEGLYHYRLNENSATHKNVIDKWNDYCKLYNKMEDEFLNYPAYDFGRQLDLVLLFLVYNSIGNINSNKELTFSKKRSLILDILNSGKVINMFKNIKIRNLNISKKLKLITVIYKYKLGLTPLIYYLSK